jgi:hypothetical protein
MRRVIIFAVLGPLLGILTGFFVLLPIVAALAGNPLHIDTDHAPFALLPVAYIGGLLPTVLVGVFDGVLANRNIGWRILWSGIFGFAMAFLPLLTSLSMGFIHGPFVLLFGAIGALPACVCSWIAGKADQRATPD